ncbi:MAG: ADOP family duplicated permease [Vicinamibacterales bacterium]
MSAPAGTAPASVRAARRLYRAATILLPRAFIAIHAAGLQAFFDEAVLEAHAAGGPRRVVRRTADALIDLIGTAGRLRGERVRELTVAARLLPREARAAARGLRRARAFAGGLLVTLVLGVGVGTALFAVVHAALLAPLPVADEDRLVDVVVHPDATAAAMPASYPEYREWRDASRTLGALAAYGRTNRTATGLDAPVRVAAALVTANFFDTLGVPMDQGRAFRPEEEPAGADDVVILSHEFRVRHYPAGGSVIGRTLRLGDRPYTIVGVLPDGFRFDLQPAEVFLPLGLTLVDLERRDSRWLGVVGRLADGTPGAEAARAELQAIAEAGNPVTVGSAAGGAPGPRVAVRRLRDAIVGGFAPVLWLLGGAALLVAGTAAASIGTLAVTRAIGRRRELAIRAALGASQSALVAAVAIEFVLLGLAGAALAAVAGAWTAQVAVHLLPDAIASRATWLAGGVPAGRLMLFALALATAACLPAVAVAARDLRRAGATGALRTGAPVGTGRRPIRGVLVAAQIALALVLLVGTGLVTRSLVRLRHVDPGFAPDRLLALGVSLPVQGYPDADAVARLYRELTARVAALPGVERAATIDEMPFTRDDGQVEVTAEAAMSGVEPVMALIRSASPGYFEAIGLAVTGGRTLEATDTAERPAVAVITDSLARRLFPDGRAVGRRLSLTRSKGRFEIVGVVGDVRMGELDREMRPAFYTSSLQDPSRSVQLVVRTGVPADRLTGDVRRVLAALDPDVPVYGVRTFAQARDATRGVTTRRLVLFPLMLFGGLATAIAVVGLYALMSQAVAERTPELGLRLALGASRGGVRRLVLRQGLVAAAAGVGAGLLLAALATRALGGVLYGVPALDPVSFLAAAAALIVLALGAAASPAARASRLDPIRSLRD